MIQKHQYIIGQGRTWRPAGLRNTAYLGCGHCKLSITSRTCIWLRATRCVYVFDKSPGALTNTGALAGDMLSEYESAPTYVGAIISWRRPPAAAEPKLHSEHGDITCP